MPRWAGDARDRLSSAAVRLFARQGFAATTVDQIAAAAGVTQRTFFRHFHDKEEVLFADDEALLAVLVEAIATAPADGDAAVTMRRVLARMAETMEPRAQLLRARAGIIATDVGLTGRELAKQVRWRDAVAEALRGRGYDAEQAALLATIGSAVFKHALDGWLAEPDGPGLTERVERGLDGLAALAAAPPPPG